MQLSTPPIPLKEAESLHRSIVMCTATITGLACGPPPIFPRYLFFTDFTDKIFFASFLVLPHYLYTPWLT